MAQNQTLQHKRSTVAGNIPTASQVAVGELAINLADRSIYTKTPSNAIVQMARDVIKSATAPTSPSPVNGSLWYDTVSDVLMAYNGTQWVSSNFSGLPILPANTTATPTWTSGSGTQASPYVFNVTVLPGDTELISSIVVTGLAPGQLVPITDLNSSTNGGRFSFTNNLADASGTLRFNIILTDLPTSVAGATLSSSIRVGTGTVYLVVNASMASNFPQPVVTFPTGISSSSTSWTAPADSLTSTGDIEISIDGVSYSQGPLAITGGATLYIRWSGTPGSGTGIDSANATTITGSVVAASNSSSVSSSLVIDKTPDSISFTAVTGASLNATVSSNTVTITDVNSYVYLTSGNTMTAAINGGTPTSIPATGTSMYVTSGQTLQVRQTSSSTVSTTTTVTVSVGGSSASFSVTTTASGTINTPSITSPINGSTGVSVGATLTSSAYAVTGIVGIHLNTDWEIYTNAGLTGTAAFSSLASTTNLTSWTPVGLGYTTQYWARVRYRSNDGTPVVSDWSTTQTWTTAAQVGVVWSPFRNPPNMDYSTNNYTAASNGTKWVVSGTTDGSLFASPTQFGATTDSGVTWTRPSGGFDAKTSVWNGTQFLFAGTSGVVKTSFDGDTWTNQTGLSSSTWSTATVNVVIWNGATYLAAGDSGKVATSTNGSAWSYRGTTMGGSSIRGAAWNGSIFVVGGDSGKIATSSDGGVTWTNQTGLSTTTWGTSTVYTIMWGNGKFVAAGDLGKVATSTDGVTWVYQTGLRTTTWGTTSPVWSGVWNGSQFIVTGSNGSVSISLDGITWGAKNGLTANPIYAIAWSGSQYIIVGSESNVRFSPF